MRPAEVGSLSDWFSTLTFKADEDAVRASLPVLQTGESLRSAREAAESAGFKCIPIEEDQLICRKNVRRWFGFSEVVWIVTLVHTDGVVRDVEVKRGIVAP